MLSTRLTLLGRLLETPTPANDLALQRTAEDGLR